MHTENLIFMVYVWSRWEILLFCLKEQKQLFTTPNTVSDNSNGCFPEFAVGNRLPIKTGSPMMGHLGDSPQRFKYGIAQVEDLACS